ncbi:MAG: hypothetical protein RL719_987 [Actinomycetota bacterium]
MSRQRLHGLDAARSTMVLLGVIVHAAIVMPAFAEVPSSDQGVLNAVYAVIHQFRMPAFFLISGLFSAQILKTEGARAYLVSRFKRIVSVMATAALIIAPLLYQTGCVWCSTDAPQDYLHTGWIYLWFLYYLAIISHLALLASLVASRLPKSFTSKVAKFVDSASFRPHVLLLMGLLMASIPGVIDASGQVRIDMGFVPNLSLIVYFSVWFSIGWLMYRSVDRLLSDLTRFAWVNLVLGLALSATSWAAFNIWHSTWQAGIQVLAVAFVTFAVLGLFMKYLHTENPTITYVSNASYWVYLFHAPILFAIIAWLGGTGLNIYLVALIAIVVTLAITLASYHWLVRSTIIGRYLSGRRRPRRQEALAGNGAARAQ